MIKVVKIGGNVLNDETALKQFCQDFAALEGPKVLVHGGGALASDMQEKLGQKPVKIQGRRVTDEDTLRIVTMVYAGWCNKQLVSLLQKNGCNAIGLSGCDGNVITACKRAPLEIEGSLVDFGFVGDVTPESVNRPLLEAMLAQGLVPVLSPINHDGEGLLLDVNDPSSVIPHITSAEYTELKASGVIADGMVPKLENAFRALRQGATKVLILNASAIAKGTGTAITL